VNLARFHLKLGIRIAANDTCSNILIMPSYILHSRRNNVCKSNALSSRYVILFAFTSSEILIQCVLMTDENTSSSIRRVKRIQRDG